MPKFDALCSRFAGGGAHNLLYDVYGDLSGGVHPSWSLVRAHFRFASTGEVIGIRPFGTGDDDVMVGRELAVSALWALYAMEVCRSGQPRMAEVVATGEEVGVPVDLRASDQRPEEQPGDASAYWLPPGRAAAENGG